MNKDKAQERFEKLQEYQGKKEARELKEQGKSIGLMVEKIASADKHELASESMSLLKPANGRYRIDQQHFALMFLEVFQKEDIATGDLKPKFKAVSDMIGIPRETLTFWWNKKDELMQQQSTMMNQGMDYLQTNFMVELIRMTQALGEVDYKEMLSGGHADQKNFISLLNTLVNKIRLLGNQSTSNVAHDHRVQMVVPED